LQRVFPDLREDDIEQRYLFRERLVQPVPVLHYSDIFPEMRTSIDGLLLANTTQIINSNLNNNAMVKIANKAVEQVSADCLSVTSPVHLRSRTKVPAGVEFLPD
jgi:hypothetical protein